MGEVDNNNNKDDFITGQWPCFHIQQTGSEMEVAWFKLNKPW